MILSVWLHETVAGVPYLPAPVMQGGTLEGNGPNAGPVQERLCQTGQNHAPQQLKVFILFVHDSSLLQADHMLAVEDAGARQQARYVLWAVLTTDSLL